MVFDNIITNYEQAIVENNCTGNTFTIPTSAPSSGGGGGGGDTIAEPPNITLYIMIIGILSAVAFVGFVYVKKSRTELKERDVEIESLKKQKEEITEEDIKISKEKRFCVVHRGPIEGYNFICPECGTFYCVKCLEAIKEIENVCWSCGKPLDPTMPAKKPLEDEGPKPVIDEESGEIDAPRKK
ncbi:hypothetical protein ES705_22449 [subsurface metagenome]